MGGLGDPAAPDESALREVESVAGMIMVTGSFHNVGDVMQARGILVG